jgi:diguanylate cyclase (GGDEF)-like protein
MVGSRSDINERKRMEDRLIYQAEHDPLTGLLNRSALLQHLENLLRLPDSHFYLFFIDVDRFKAVNDSLGHAIGDQLLVAFARSLQQLVRPIDRVARLSGDEFVLVLSTGQSNIDLYHLAERIRSSLQIQQFLA